MIKLNHGLHRRDICAASIGMLGLGALSSIARASTRVVNEAGTLYCLAIRSSITNRMWVMDRRSSTRSEKRLAWTGPQNYWPSMEVQHGRDRRTSRQDPRLGTHVIISSGGNDALNNKKFCFVRSISSAKHCKRCTKFSASSERCTTN